MTPSPPIHVIVRVRTGMLMLNLGQVRVQGRWAEPERPALVPWESQRSPVSAWKPLAVPVPRAWRTEEP